MCSGTTAQTVFREFNINNGLPHTDAFCTVQDSKGFLWFATLDGLCRYDGFDMIVYRNDHSDPFSLTNNRIIALEYDHLRNGLWIGTQGGGLNYMDLVSGKFYHVDLKNNGQPVKEVLVIKIIEKQTILVGTNEGLYEGVINNKTPYTPALNKTSIRSGIVESIFDDRNHGVWVGTLANLYYKPVGSPAFSPVFTDVLGDVSTLVAYDDRHILAGSPNGLFIVNLENFTLRKLNGLKATSLYVENVASIWVGTLASGLFNCNAEGLIVDSFPFDPSSIKFKIKDIFRDRSSSLFISTQGEGIKIINENNHTFTSYPQNVAAAAYSELKRPLCFYADDDSTVLIGTRRSGLAVYERFTDRVRFFNIRGTTTDQVTRSNITAVFKDSNKNLWIGDGKGVVILDGKFVESKAFHSYLFQPLSGFPLPVRVNKIIQDKKLRVWVVTSRGLFCYDQNRKLIFNSSQLLKNYKSIQSDYLNDIILNEDDNGHSLVLWVAGKSGIWRVKLNNIDFSLMDFQKFTAGPAENQLYANWISLLHQDRDGNIWAGTIGGGLSLMVPEKNGNYSFRTITTKNGLLTNDIETLLEDAEGNFWIGSIGLTKYNPKNRTFTYYDDNDGLQSNAFKVWAAFKRGGGEMFFGGINGFNIFYPQSIGKKSEVYSPQLTNLVINNINVKPGISIEGKVILEQSLPYTGEITLNHKIGSFGMEFASIHSHDFQKIVYRYMLKGYDKEWIYTNSKKRFVNYTDLPAGDYVFQVAASGGDGIWSARPVTLKINIVPSFWVSRYGYLLYAVVFVFAIFLQRRYALIRLDVKHKLEIDETKRKQEVKLYEDKMQFFTNISHELRTPLTLITSPIEQLVNHADLPARVNDKLAIVQKNAQRLRYMIDQVLDIRKLELGKLELQKDFVNVKEFLQNVFLQFQDLVQSKSVTFKMDVQFEQQVLIDVFKMEQVMINLLTNAIKFTPEAGEITISGYQEDNQLVISVCNSGTMLGAEERARIFEPFYQVNGNNRHGTGLGLTISKNLVELHQGTIRVDSFRSINTGVPFTSFAVMLPLTPEKASPLIIAEDQTAVNGIEEQIAETSKAALRQSIVFVDDNEELTNIFKEEFQPEYNVYTAANGKDALKIIRKIKPAIIITDIMMPVMDGMVLCKAIKNDVAINDIPLIILTAKTTEQSRMAGLELMADDYISKPFSLRELHLKVRNIILKRSSLRTKINNDVILNPTALNLEPRDERIIKDAIAIIEKNMDNTDFSVEQLCKDANTSRPVLYRKIKDLTGMSIQVFILDIRLKRAAQLLKTKSLSVSEVMFSTGFSSPSYFNKAFKNKFNSSPAQYTHQ